MQFFFKFCIFFCKLFIQIIFSLFLESIILFKYSFLFFIIFIILIRTSEGLSHIRFMMVSVIMVIVVIIGVMMDVSRGMECLRTAISVRMSSHFLGSLLMMVSIMCITIITHWLFISLPDFFSMMWSELFYLIFNRFLRVMFMMMTR